MEDLTPTKLNQEPMVLDSQSTIADILRAIGFSLEANSSALCELRNSAKPIIGSTLPVAHIDALESDSPIKQELFSFLSIIESMRKDIEDVTRSIDKVVGC